MFYENMTSKDNQRTERASIGNPGELPYLVIFLSYSESNHYQKM
jgi:hypothetical protein